MLNFHFPCQIPKLFSSPPILSDNSISIFKTQNTNPYYNLALENWLFRQNPKNHILFLWQNEPCVIIGRSQNTFKEVNVPFVEKNNIHIVRRQSGGGTVYQDLGNMNYTLISPKALYNRPQNLEIFNKALYENFQIHSKSTGRNDFIVNLKEHGHLLGPHDTLQTSLDSGDIENNERKISGSAFSFTGKTSMHHGSILMNVDIHSLVQSITPSKKKLITKGVESVRNRVINLVELNSLINFNSLSNALAQKFSAAHGYPFVPNTSIIEISPDFLDDSILNHFSDKNYVYGKNPKFSFYLEEKFPFGMFEFHINSSRNMIESIEIFSDSLHPESIPVMVKYLKDIPFTPEAIENAFSQISSQVVEEMKPACQVLGQWLGRQHLI